MTRLNSTFVMIFAGILLYSTVIIPYSSYMCNRPVAEKLGYITDKNILKMLSADQQEMLAASLVMKVLIYFGGISQQQQNMLVTRPPEYQGMSRILHAAVKLDPYNMDAYYFAQSFLTWDVKQYKIANELLDYGMKYRTWDWYLPFFAGFNSAYFLKDFKSASEYYKKAGDLSGQDLHRSLAGLYMQESGQTELAIAYLTAMEKGERNAAVRKNYQTRLAAFKEVRRIELAVDRYKDAQGTMPATVEQLVGSGYLSPAPVDPYRGEFYLGPDGKVGTTSKFAFGGKTK